MEKLWEACRDGTVEEVQKLLQNRQTNINWQNHNDDLTTPFYIACQKGHIEVVKLLLNDNRVDTNKARDDGYTPFFIACSWGHTEIVKLLLNDERVNINKASNNGLTPFYSACQNGHIEIVRLLLNDNRVDINKASNNESTPFSIACYSGKTEVVKYLLESEREIDINQKDKYGNTGLDWARQEGNIDVIKLIESFQMNPIYEMQMQFWEACSDGKVEEVQKLLHNLQFTSINRVSDGKAPFHIACINNSLEVIKILFCDERVHVNQVDDDGKTPFYFACENGHIEIVKLLLNDKRVDINKPDNESWTPFLIACGNGKIEVVKYLLESGREIDINKTNSEGETPFFIACQRGHIQVVKLLLSDKRINKIQTRNDYWATFWMACYDGHIDVVKSLLNDNRIDINKANKYKATPFHVVCNNGHIETVKLLLNDQRVDVNQIDIDGKTPFYIACQNRHIEIVKLLLNDQRVDIIKTSNDGKTPFHIACKNNSLETIKILLNDQRIDINKASNDGTTSFYIACQNGNIDIVKLLLNDERIDINKARNNGQTPFYIACKKGYIEIVKLFLNDKRISIRKKTKDGKTAIDIARTNNHSEVMKLIKELDTEQRYLEYLETFQSLVHIENEKIDKQDFFVLNEYIKKNNNIQELRLINCDLTHSHILEILKTLIWKYENLQLSNLQNIEIDNIKLGSTEGLERIPIEIRNQGTKSIVQYILDLNKSSNSNSNTIASLNSNLNSKSISTSKPLYRTKLMVVGYENVGKTSILDCLFPIQNLGEKKRKLVRTEYLMELEGKRLRRYLSKELNKDCKEIILENKQWSVQERKETGLELIPLNDKNQKKIKIYFEDKETRDKWIERLKRVILNAATHGIEVNSHIWKSSTLNQYQNKDLEAKQNGNTNGNQNEKKDKDDYVEYSTWDFAGQNDYYNTHHYFLSNRSIFLVLYRMDKGIKGLESLDFWLKSLSSHLNQNYCDGKGKPFYSIIIIGTFLDSIVINQNNDKDSIVNGQNEDKNLRQTKIMEIYDKNGLKSPPFYFEVSCSTLENIDELREIIFNISLSHSYMGEKIPIGYLSIEKSIYELRKLKQGHPIIEIQDLIYHVQFQYQSQLDIDIDFTKRALKLLHEWGICIYFDEPIELSNIVVLDPQYFTKTILGDLFKADESMRQIRSNGIIDYSQLNKIWNGSINLIDTYLSLLEKFEVCFILKDQQNQNGNGNEKKLIIPNLLPDPNMIKEIKNKILELMKELEELEKSTSKQTQKEKIVKEREKIQKENKKMADIKSQMEQIKSELEKKWPETIPRGGIEIERIFSFNQVPSEMVSRLLVRFHDRIVDNIIWRRGVLLKHFKNENILCLLEVKMLENIFEIRIRGKERKECLEMMKYIYEEVKIVSGNYGGVKWKECVRSPHFSKGLIQLDEIFEDRKLELKDRKLICPITHFPIYSEELLFKTGLLDSFHNRNNIGNDYWNYSYENQNQENQENQKSETEIIFENSQKLNKKVEHLLNLFGFDLSRVDKVIGIENKSWKRSFEVRSKQIYGRHKDTPNIFKREDWIEQPGSELRKSFVQYLGDYISKFRKLGWNHGNNPFVIPMIQGTSEDAALRIYDNGFGTVCKVDAGFYAQGVYVTSKAEYAEKYCQENLKVFVIGFVIVGNPFPVIEHPSTKKYLGKSINSGYQSHFTLVDGRDINTAFPITKVEQLNEKWIADELVLQESQTYPSYIVYYK